MPTKQCTKFENIQTLHIHTLPHTQSLVDGNQLECHMMEGSNGRQFSALDQCSFSLVKKMPVLPFPVFHSVELLCCFDFLQVCD